MKVGVIGAGPSGLTTIKQLRDEGHDVVCLEKSADIGGIWYRDGEDRESMKAYDDLYLTISMKLMSFSDFMVEDRVFADRQGYLKYLNDYTDKYGLRQCIRFNSTVEAIEKSGDDWKVSVTANGRQEHHLFQALAVCSGPFQTPATSIPYLKRFSGEVIHSSRYRNNRKFEGKRVLVIGLSESGADIVRQISEVSSECTLAIRSRSYLVPRLYDGQYSTDSTTLRAHHYEMYVRSSEHPFPMGAFFRDETMSAASFMDAIRQHGMLAAMTKAAGSFDLESLGTDLLAEGRGEPLTAVTDAMAKVILGAPTVDVDDLDPQNSLGQPLYPPKLDLFTEANKETFEYISEWNRKSHEGEDAYSPRVIFCKNVSFVPNVLNGKIQVNDSDIETIEGSTVYFKDRTAKDYDCIVLCTGFERDFSFLRGVEIPENNVRYLYKHAFHPDHGGRLALIGFVRPFSGGIPICAEMQARYFALLCSDKLELPADIIDRIKADKAWEEKWTELSPRHSEAVPSQLFFLDSIAKDIGCLPTCEQLVDEPELLVKLWFYPFNQLCYRIVGPHSMQGDAKKSLMSEELPADSLLSMFYFMASSLWPPHVRPKALALNPSLWELDD
ncbi:flavin-containing monooxygenase [Mycobacterium szulgai]|uniref:flavin-containing monooxygenase n=1 Tax=Mycobacterium szulgai TaxID=1787 RepID=UPI000A1D6320|nr:NAD(P)-binding domain-containing protein [Mycobacterium szulgai]MCV7078588.1 NAD(P)-binding domain-containing protein [Mycobacterium szulgai]